MARTAQRRWNRYVKGMRRIREDRAEHGDRHTCPCFDANGSGYTFSMFADTPKRCGQWCCGNPRRHHGTLTGSTLTMQERRAPTVCDWD